MRGTAFFPAINSIQHLLRKKSLVLGGNIAVALSSLVLSTVIIRSAGPGNYGSFVVAGSVVAFLYGISSFGIDFRYKRDFSSDFLTESKRWSSFAPQLIAQVIVAVALGIICVCSSRWIAAFFHTSVLPWWSLPFYLILYVLYGQASDYFRYSSRVRPTMGMAVGFAVGQLILTGGLWLVKGTLTIADLFFALFGALLLTTIIALWFILPELKLSALPRFWSKWRSDFKMGYPITLNFVVDHALNSTGRYALAAMVSASSLAHYNVAFLVAGFGLLLPRASGIVLPPLMARHFDSGSPEAADGILIWTTRVYLIVGLPFVVGSILLEKKILTLFATADVAAQANYVLPLLSAGYLCYGLITIWSNALFVTRDLHALLKINACAAAITVLLTWGSLYLTSSITLAAACFLFSYIFACAMMIRKLRGNWHIGSSFSVIPRAVVAAGAMGIALHFLSPLTMHLSPIVSLVSLISLGIIAYFGLIFLLGLHRTIFANPEKL